jgi:hypothetical protein
MMFRSLIFVLVTSASAVDSTLSVAGEARFRALEQQWSQDLPSTASLDVASGETKVVMKTSPINRVVKLLREMKAELVAEANKEAEMYDKMVCWCETNEKEKTKAIADADALQKELTAQIEGMAAKFGEETTEIARLKEQIADDTAAEAGNSYSRKSGSEILRDE